MPSLSGIHWMIITLSTIFTFIILLVLVRWLGATQLTQLTFFNWVAGASMGNIAANMITAHTTQDWMTAGYSLVVFTVAAIVAAWIALKSRTFRRVANGEPLILIHKGAILRANLVKSRINVDVLLMLLREKGYFSYNDVEYAILETTGNLSILPIPESQSASKADLVSGPNLAYAGGGPYVVVVVDGKIDWKTLQGQKLDENWIHEQVIRHGGHGLADVTYLAVNQEGEVVLDLHRREVTKVKQ